MCSAVESATSDLNFLLNRPTEISTGDFPSRWVALSVGLATDAVRRVFHNADGPGPRGEAFPFAGLEQVTLAQVTDAAATACIASARDRLVRLSPAVDFSASLAFVSSPVTIKDGSGPVQLTILSKRRPDLSTAEYQSYWKNDHAAVVMRQPRFSRCLLGYRQNHIKAGSFVCLDGSPAPDHMLFDGMMQMWFGSHADMRVAFECDDYRTIVRKDEYNFIAVGQSIAFTTQLQR